MALWIPVWLSLRIVTVLWAAQVSSLRPLSEIEKTVSVWPPSPPFVVWLERVALSPWERWDALHFVRIAGQGYQAGDATTAFYPLFAWLSLPLVKAGLSPLLGLIAVSSLACLGLLPAMERLARLDLDRESARASVVLLLSFPPAFILFAPYTEALFLVCSVLCLLWARLGAFWLAGLAGALAALTRQQGLFLAVPVACELWQVRCRSVRPARSPWRDWLPVFLIPGVVVLWVIYRAVALPDLKPDFTSVNSLAFSLLVSPNAENLRGHRFDWPWVVLPLALKRLWTSPGSNEIVNLALGSYFAGLLAVAWPRMRTSYRLYSAAIALVSFSYHTGPVHAYMGLPRHLLLAFPVFIGLGGGLRRLPRLILASAGLVGSLFLVFLYVLEAWVP